MSEPIASSLAVHNAGTARIAMIEAATETRELLDVVRPQIDAIAEPLLDMLVEARRSGNLPTFSVPHAAGEVEYTLWPAHVHWHVRGRTPVTKRFHPTGALVLGAEPPIPAARRDVDHSRDAERHLLLLQPPYAQAEALPRPTHPEARCDWTEGIHDRPGVLTIRERQLLSLAGEDVLLAFAAQATDIVEQLLTRSQARAAQAHDVVAQLDALHCRLQG